MACGAPTVARDTVFNREVLGENAVFTPPIAADITNVILGLMADHELQDTLSFGARARQETAYSWRGVCVAYDKALRAAIPSESTDMLSPLDV
jgi:glycosyltransferase involved in cell wall biosynthesis